MISRKSENPFNWIVTTLVLIIDDVACTLDTESVYLTV